jgi:hypothetical protein
MKKCPYCTKQILDAETLCPYCGRTLMVVSRSKPAQKKPVPAPKTEKEKRQEKKDK